MKRYLLQLLVATSLGGYATSAFAANTVDLTKLTDTNLTVAITQLGGDKNSVKSGYFTGTGSNFDIIQVGSSNSFELNPDLTLSGTAYGKAVNNSLVKVTTTGNNNTIAVGVLTADAATPSSGNKITISATGKYNTNKGGGVDTYYIVGQDNVLSTTVTGDSNRFTTSVNGNSNSNAVTIQGNTNSTVDAFIGNNNSNILNINGNNNVSSSLIHGGNSNTLQQTLTGDQNIVLNRVYLGSSNSIVEAVNGDNNKLRATLGYLGKNSNNNAVSLSALGMSNIVSGVIEGSGNLMTLSASGNLNEVGGIQTGNNNIMNVAFKGNRNADNIFTQAGNNKVLNFSYTGSGVSGLRLTQ